MISSELKKAISSYEPYIEKHGIDLSVTRAYHDAVFQAAEKDNDIESALKISKRAKEVMNEYCIREYGGDIWKLEKYCFENKTGHEMVDKWYEILKLETPHKFESFIFYMEKNREHSKRFYLPRINPMKTVVSDLQDLEDRKSGKKFYGLSMPSRVGKAIAYNTPVLTSNGWKKHGELTILDEIIGIDGNFKKILSIHNPCEMEYKVIFSDGEEIVCHGNHEWRVFDRHGKKQKNIETKTMIETLYEKDGRCRYYIPQKEILCGSHKPLWVSPYALGAWLGDGRNTNPDICGSESDYPIIQKIIDDGYDLAWDTKHKTTGVRYYGFKNLRKDLQHYGMCHSRKTTPKHIPEEYLIADIEQRLELLAGLLDTDGSLNKKERRYQFTTNEPILRDDFVSLVNTFGWRTCIVKYESGMSSSGIYANKPYWVISFNPTTHIPCQLERKKLYEFSKQNMISIKKIEKVPTGIFGNCITVEDGIYCVGKTLKPTHNSTDCIFFLSWIALKRPNSHSAMGGHSGILAKGFYKELMNLITTTEYTFKELFDYVHPEYINKSFPTDKSADEFTITLGDPDRFATITCRGIDGTWTGAIDISSDGYLYVDDLVRDRQHSLSPRRMQETYQEYLNKMVDRKIDGARELMVGTLWNVLDPLEKIRKEEKDNPEYGFRKIPALNEKDESNFDYKINGFSTKYYHDMRDRLDKAEWMAKFMQQPFVREGLLFPPDELQFFNGILPDGDFRIVAAVDVAWGGGDSLSMPIGAEYESGDVYIFAWVFNKEAKEVTLPLVTGQIINNKIRQIRFEGNVGGDLYCKYVDEMLQKQGWKCSCTHRKAPNTMEKMSKIIAYSGDIKRKYHFLTSKIPTKEEKEKDKELGIIRYVRDKEYQDAMDELETFVTIGKNDHEDAADGITQLEMFIENPSGVRKTVIMASPI